MVRKVLMVAGCLGTACATLMVVQVALSESQGLVTEVESEGADFRVVHVGASLDDLHLYWRDDSGAPIRSFMALEELLHKSGKKLVFATNAGIYEPGLVPTGLHIEDGKELRPINLDEGRGNFFLKPNGVFYVGQKGPGICASEAFKDEFEPRIACQSGPLLVQGGQIHPVFSKESRHRFVRSGVGIDNDGEVVFAISEAPVTLYAFAQFFRDALDCADALYLDGAISRFYVPGDSKPARSAFAGILALVKD